jgi:hypothetical protein
LEFAFQIHDDGKRSINNYKEVHSLFRNLCPEFSGRSSLHSSIPAHEVLTETTISIFVVQTGLSIKTPNYRNKVGDFGKHFITFSRDEECNDENFKIGVLIGIIIRPALSHGFQDFFLKIILNALTEKLKAIERVIK